MLSAGQIKLLGIVGLVVLALLIAGDRITGQADHAQDGTVVAQRDLVFQDRTDGAVVALAASSHQPVEVFQGENGFLRGTLRGFARIRKSEHLGADLPFRLAQWSDGRLTLDDPATGRHVELLAFGPSNAGVFYRLLTERAGSL